jgi:NADPH2:quinone reductase
MKAIRVHEHGPPLVMRLEEVPEPQAGAGQVLVRVHAAGVNPVDTYIRAGTQGYGAPLPYTPGFDAAGVVEAVGPGVQRVVIGQRVYTAGTLSGAYAEKALCAEAQVHPLPERVTYGQGAALGVPYATAYRALFHRGGAQPGDILLVHGASGGVGIPAVQMARAAGLTVIGTAGTAEGRVLVRDEGAHHVLDHRASGYLDGVMQLTGGRGVDLVLEMLANVNLAHDLGVLARGGRVVVIGSRGSVEVAPRELMRRDADIRGMTLMLASAEELARIHAAIAAGLESGSYRPVVGRELALAEAPQAHQIVMDASAYGKVVLLPD